MTWVPRCARLPGSASTLETHVDVTIGEAVTRFPVTVHRGFH
jgi:hypothetical protein